MLQQLQIILPLIAQIPPLLRGHLLLLDASLNRSLLIGALDENPHMDVHVSQKVLQGLAVARGLLNLLIRRRVDLLVRLDKLKEECLQRLLLRLRLLKRELLLV